MQESCPWPQRPLVKYPSLQTESALSLLLLIASAYWFGASGDESQSKWGYPGHRGWHQSAQCPAYFSSIETSYNMTSSSARAESLWINRVTRLFSLYFLVLFITAYTKVSPLCFLISPSVPKCPYPPPKAPSCSARGYGVAQSAAWAFVCLLGLYITLSPPLVLLGPSV